MNILEILIKLRDDLKLWVTNNILALKEEINKSKFSGEYSDLYGKPDIDGKIEKATSTLKTDILSLDSDLVRLNENFSTHESDTTTHITDNERTDWNSHIGNSTLHVTANDKFNWDNKSEFSGNYNDLEDAPDISDDNSDDLKFIDEAGNIIFSIDAEGLHSTNLELIEGLLVPHADISNVNANTIILNGEDISDAMDNKVNSKFAELIDSAPSTLDTLNELATALGNDPNFATTVVEQLGLKANKTDVPTKVSQLQNDKKYLTEVPNDYMTEIEINDLLIPINAHISLSEKNIATLMASNTVVGSVDNKIKVSMDNEIIARTAGDTNSLNSAKSYTDQQIGVEVTARNNADATTLSSAKDYTDKKVEEIVTNMPSTGTEVFTNEVIDSAFSSIGL